MKRLICWGTLALAAASAVAQARPDANTAKIFKGYSLTDLTAAGLLYDPQAKATYRKALGELVKEPWLANLDGPSNEFRPVKVAGEDYMLGRTAKTTIATTTPSCCCGRACRMSSTARWYRKASRR